MTAFAGVDPFVRRGERVAEAPRVSICVLALRSVDRLRSCLRSLRAHVDPALAEIIVVGNQMRPAEADTIGPHDDLVLLVSEINLGFGGGNNYAASHARGEYLVLLNDDSTVEPGWLDNLLLTADADPSIGAVGSCIVAPDGTLQEAGSVLWHDGLASHIGEGLEGVSTRYQYRRLTDYASANGLMVRRSAWDALGGFDDRFHPAYYEDVDLCLGLEMLGYRVAYEPRAVISHAGSQSTTNLFLRFLLERNRHLCVEKWRDQFASFGALEGDKASAIDTSIARVRGFPSSALVVLDRLSDADAAGQAAPWRAVVELAASGWAVTLVLTEGVPSDLSCVVDRSGTRDRLIDLGVECFFGSLDAFWLSNRIGFDVVAVTESVRSSWLPVPVRVPRRSSSMPMDGHPCARRSASLCGPWWGCQPPMHQLRSPSSGRLRLPTRSRSAHKRLFVCGVACWRPTLSSVSRTPTSKSSTAR